jgi:TATA-box binding protein (TBP) (component of TFIID and TFIIIB)
MRVAVLRLAFHDFTYEPEEFEGLMAEAEDEA